MENRSPFARPVCLAAAAALCAGCGGPPQNPAPREPSRYFGNMPLSIDPTLATGIFHFTDHHIREDSNLLALHIGWFPIPWAEFAAGTDPPPAWLAEMDAISALRDRLGLPVYLALNPLNGDRDSLEVQATGTTVLSARPFGGRCEPIASRPDYATVVLPAYLAYVEYMVERFRPRFLATSVEVNVYAINCPAAWADMKALVNDVYLDQKSRHPELPVFQTFQIEGLWGGDAGVPASRDSLARNMTSIADLRSDIFAMSTYPIATYVAHNRALPDDYLTVFSTLQLAPLAISETGYSSSTVWAIDSSGSCTPLLPSSVGDQRWWVDRVIADADRLNMPFVTWWANEDPIPAAELTGGCGCTDTTVWCNFLQMLDAGAQSGLRFFSPMGLREFDGTPRPARADWTAAVQGAAL